VAAVDNVFAISFERIGRVVQAYAKEQSDKVVGQPVENQLHFGIINNTTTTREAAPKDTV
jgi:hypothetical protein